MKIEATIQNDSASIFLRYIQQLKLSFSAAFDTGDWLAFIATVRYVLLIDIPVAGLYFLDKVTLRAFAIAEQSAVNQHCKPRLLVAEHLSHTVGNTCIAPIGRL